MVDRLCRHRNYGNSIFETSQQQIFDVALQLTDARLRISDYTAALSLAAYVLLETDNSDTSDVNLDKKKSGCANYHQWSDTISATQKDYVF